MKLAPIGEWPGTPTLDRRRSNFGSTLTATKADLDRELRALRAEDVLLQIGIPVGGKWRIDGYPYSNARPEHPGLILTMVTEHGPLSYPCDTFTQWADNLRAIALALEALRKVDRYGVTKRGEQYRGFLAIEATAMPAGFTSTESATDFLSAAAKEQATSPLLELPALLRLAKRRSHPDTGGDADTFQRVTLAEQYLKQNGSLK